MTTVTYSAARERLAELWNEIEESREEIILQRRGHEDLALIPAQELRSLKEVAYLLRSPANAARLLAALEQSRAGSGTGFESIEAVAAEVGLGGEAELSG